MLVFARRIEEILHTKVMDDSYMCRWRSVLKSSCHGTMLQIDVTRCIYVTQYFLRLITSSKTALVIWCMELHYAATLHVFTLLNTKYSLSMCIDVHFLHDGSFTLPILCSDYLRLLYLVRSPTSNHPCFLSTLLMYWTYLLVGLSKYI